MAVDLSDIVVMDGSASAILVGEDIATGDIICKPNIPGPALAYKANASKPDRDNVIGISVTTTNAGGQCFYVRRGAIIESANISNSGNDTSYWLSDTDGQMGSYSEFAVGGNVVMIAEAWVYEHRVKLSILDYKKKKETPLPADNSKPGVPLALTATRAVDSIDLSWTAPTSESRIYAYILKRGNATLYEGPLTTFSDSGLTAGTDYTYKVAAISNSGTGEYAEETFTTLPADTTIGTVTVAGSEAVTEADVATYSVSNDGDAADLTYAWAVEGGTGTSTTASCEVTWGSSGPGKVTCTISSTEDTVTDSPVSGELDVTISV